MNILCICVCIYIIPEEDDGRVRPPLKTTQSELVPVLGKHAFSAQEVCPTPGRVRINVSKRAVSSAIWRLFRDGI